MYGLFLMMRFAVGLFNIVTALSVAADAWLRSVWLTAHRSVTTPTGDGCVAGTVKPAVSADAGVMAADLIPLPGPSSLKVTKR